VEAPGDDKWKTKRKICATAFYKERLINMTSIMRKTTKDKIDYWFDGGSNKITVNMTEELNDIFTRIILTICFGYDCSQDVV
jgi:cytochrome P450